jgi:predicted PurR-regulated permease PerM
MSDSLEYVFHMPWWVALLIAVVGAWLFVLGNRRLDKTLRRRGAAVVAVAVVLGLVGFFWLTPLQKAVGRTKQLIHDVDRQNWTDLGAQLDDQTLVQAVGRTMAEGRDDCVKKVKSAYDRYGVKSVWILSVDGVQTESIITVTAVVVSQQDATGGQGVTSTWQLEYEQDGSQWLLQKIILIRVGGEDGQHPINPF